MPQSEGLKNTAINRATKTPLIGVKKPNKNPFIRPCTVLITSFITSSHPSCSSPRHRNKYLLRCFRCFISMFLGVRCLPPLQFRGGCLEDHPRTCKWLITMVIVSLLSRVGLSAFSWLINGGDPNHLQVLG